MKIIFIAPGTLEIPVVTYGGIERVIWNLANGFIKKGYRVKVLSKRNKSFSDTQNIIFDPYRSDKVTLSKSNVEKFPEDLVHHPKAYLEGVFAYLEQNIKKEDVVFLNHSEQKLIRNFLEKNKIRFYEIAHYKNFSGNTNIIFPSNFLKKIFFLKSGIVIPHPVDENEFFISKDKPLVEDKYILYVGRINKHKRTKLVFDIAKELGVKCVIAGPIEDEVYAEKFLHNCIYFGNCDSSQLRNLYSNALATACVTSFFPPEAFGLFQVEAQMCGSYIISSKNAGLKDTFYDNCCVEYSSYKGVTKVSREFNIMMSSKNALTKEEISMQIKKHFSIEVVVDMYIKRLGL